MQKNFSNLKASLWKSPSSDTCSNAFRKNRTRLFKMKKCSLKVLSVKTSRSLLKCKVNSTQFNRSLILLERRPKELPLPLNPKQMEMGS